MEGRFAKTKKINIYTMRELISTISLILIFIGMFAALMLSFFYTIWRPRKKRLLRQKEFRKAVWLVSIATAMSGLGLGITVASDQEGWLAKIAMILVCGGLPSIWIIFVFIRGLKQIY